jgi:hypothetical protein
MKQVDFVFYFFVLSSINKTTLEDVGHVQCLSFSCDRPPTKE